MYICPILKRRFPSSFASKGRGLPAGLQSSSKAALYENFTWHEVHRNPHACNGIAQILKSPKTGYYGTRQTGDSLSHVRHGSVRGPGAWAGAGSGGGAPGLGLGGRAAPPRPGRTARREQAAAGASAQSREGCDAGCGVQGRGRALSGGYAPGWGVGGRPGRAGRRGASRLRQEQVLKEGGRVATRGAECGVRGAGAVAAATAGPPRTTTQAGGGGPTAAAATGPPPRPGP